MECPSLGCGGRQRPDEHEAVGAFGTRPVVGARPRFEGLEQLRRPGAERRRDHGVHHFPVMGGAHTPIAEKRGNLRQRHS